MAFTIYHSVDGTVQTTDGTTQVTVISFDTSTGAPGGGALNNCTIFINGTSAGYDSADGQGGGERVGAVFKVVTGTLSQIGATQHVTPMQSDAGGSLNSGFSVSGTIIQYWVIGAGGKTINWLGKMDLHINQP